MNWLKVKKYTSTEILIGLVIIAFIAVVAASMTDIFFVTIDREPVFKFHTK